MKVLCSQLSHALHALARLILAANLAGRHHYLTSLTIEGYRTIKWLSQD